jgi:hypothetical protein
VTSGFTLEDRFAIQDVLFRYARAVDRLDYAGIAACYFPDAIDEHGGYVGTVDGLVEDIRRRHQTIDSSQHFVSNVLIDWRGTHADVESYCLCYLRQRRQDGRQDQDISVIRCRYVDRFEKRAGEWRIAARAVVFDEVVQTTAVDSLDPTWIASTRDAHDRVYSGQAGGSAVAVEQG